jgi:hypothetical protein
LFKKHFHLLRDYTEERGHYTELALPAMTCKHHPLVPSVNALGSGYRNLGRWQSLLGCDREADDAFLDDDIVYRKCLR